MTLPNNMLKKSILVLFSSLALFCSSVRAQSLADLNSPKIVPPTPDAAALGKYAQIPVDKGSGVPGISVPLYEIKTPRFSLPISLSYHASGIKVDETASWVGIGWSLNCGGVVTRSMVGAADDAGTGFLTLAIPTAQDLFQNFNNNKTYMQSVADGQSDSEPDNFFYNFSGGTGGFVFDAVGKAPILIPYRPLKISFTPAGGGSGSYFSIVDPEGNSYLFKDTEISYSSVSGALTGASSWYLSQMISADKSDTVKFFYKPDPNNFNFVDNSYSFTQNVGPLGGPTSVAAWNMVPTTNTCHSQSIHIDSIVFKGGKVDFVPKAGRMDNGAISLDSLVVSNYDYKKKKYSRLKSFKLLTDYFYSTINNPPAPYNYNTDNTSRYRLKLTGLSENDGNNSAIKTHQFAYNTTMLPPLHNFGQDVWGYYNGNWNNQTLLQAAQVSGFAASPTTVFTIAGNGLGANRDVSLPNMQAGVLEKITYPTKGYTTFTYEANQYIAPTVTTNTASTSSVGVYAPTTSTTFTASFANPNQTSGQLIFNIQLGRIANISNSYVQLIQVSNGAVIYAYYPSTSADVNTTVGITVTAGVQYKLVAVSIGGSTSSMSSLPYSAINTTYQVTGSPTLNNVGGLRVKYIRNYDSNGTPIFTETYKYGSNESGAGLFSSSAGLPISHSQHSYMVGSFPAVEDTYSSSSIYPLSSFGGSPVAYDQVTVYHGDTLQNIGKSVYNYAVTGDSILTYSQPQVNTPFYTCNCNIVLQNWQDPLRYIAGAQGMKPISRQWQNGEPVSESHYLNNNGQYLLQQSKSTSYSLFYRPYGRGLSLRYSRELAGGASRVDYPANTSNEFTFYDYPISTGSRVPSRTVTTNYGSDGVTQLTSDTAKYAYGNPAHMFPTRTVSYNGKGDSLVTKASYPQDMVLASSDPTGIYASMASANMVSPPVEVTNYKNVTQLQKSKTNYAVASGNIKPQTVELQTLGSPSEVRLNFQKYDTRGNVLTVSKQGGTTERYIWDYQYAYSAAKVTNAGTDSIAYTSFEADGKGNWIIASPVRDTSAAITGGRSYNLSNGALSKGGLTAASAYVVSYWTKSSAALTIAGTASGYPVNGANTRGWYYHEHRITGQTTVTLSGAGNIDELRLYPAGAQMSTYTYAPLVGVTSISDAKSLITYYEYDGLQRLLNIKDQNGKILKSYDYNYVSTAPIWTDNTGRRCKSGTTTGEQERQETDTNPLSATYNQTRWVSNGIDTVACPLPAIVYVKQTVGSTSVSNGVTYNTLKFNTYSDVNCTTLVNAPVTLTVNYTYVTSASYADGRTPNPTVTTTNATITIASGTSQSTSGSIIISGCFGIGTKQICYTPTTQITVQPGTGYTAVNPEI
jgi:YD repeat-containing protein